MPNPINVKFPIKKSPNGAFEMNYTTIDAVATDLRILILTNHGERPCNYFYGANLRSLLFEPMGTDTKQKVADLIFSAVERWMPFVFINELDVLLSTEDASIGPNQIRILAKFSVLQETGQLEVQAG